MSVQDTCEVCKAPYPASLLLTFEAMPVLHIGTFVLRYPVLLVLVAQFYVGACVQSYSDKTVGLHVCSKGSHILVHAAYVCMLSLFGQVRDTTSYRTQHAKTCLFIPAIHAAILAYAAWFQHTEFYYIADIWLSAYWIAHEKVIHDLNRRLLGMED